MYYVGIDLGGTNIAVGIVRPDGSIVAKKSAPTGAGRSEDAVIAADGELCNCGRRGCFEAYSSATALVRDTRAAAEAHRDSLLWQCAEEEGKFSGRTAFEAARRGDVVARGVVERYIRYLAVGVGNAIEIFQPDVVVIGGGVSHEGEALFTPLIEQVKQDVYGDHVPEEKQTKILAARLGNDAGIVGAALLGEESI